MHFYGYTQAPQLLSRCTKERCSTYEVKKVALKVIVSLDLGPRRRLQTAVLLTDWVILVGGAVWVFIRILFSLVILFDMDEGAAPPGHYNVTVTIDQSYLLSLASENEVCVVCGDRASGMPNIFG